MPHLSAAGLTHLLRGLYFASSEHRAAAIPHLRLALIFDKDSAFVHERLSRAWASTGEEDKATAALEAGLRQRHDDPGLNLLAGHLAAKRRDHGEAVRHFRLAMRDERSLAEAGPRLVDALLWLDRREEASNTARQLVAEEPDEIAMVYGVAAFLEDHGELELSLEIYRHGRQQRPADRATAIGEIRVLDLLGRTEEATDSLVSLFAFYPDAPDLYVAITRLLRRLDNPDADAYRAEALRQTDGDPRGRLLVAMGDVMEGRIEDGVAVLRETSERFPDYRATRTFLAEVLGGQRDDAGCLAALEVPANEVDPFHRTRAWCHGIGGRAEALISELRAAMAGGESAGEALQEGARLLSNRFPTPEARRHFTALSTALGEEIPADDLELAKAALADAAGDGAEAIELVRAVRQRRGQAPHLTLRLADLEVRYGDAEAGVALLEELLAEDPGDPIRLNALGFTLADIDLRLGEANVWLRRAYRLAAEDGFVIDSLGWLLHRQGRHAEALRLLQRAARATVNDPEILRHLGDIHHALGDTEQARRAYLRALDAFPNPNLRRLIDERLSEYELAPSSS